MKPTTANKFYLITIAVMIAYIFYLQGCSGTNSSGFLVGSKVVHTYMAGYRILTKEVPGPVRELPPDISTAVAAVSDSTGIDSSACVHLAIDHLTERSYTDSLVDDTAAVIYELKVRENKLDTILLKYRILAPMTTTITNTYQPARVQVFIAGNVGTDLHGFAAGPYILVKDKRGFLYGAGATFKTSGRHYYGATFGKLLSFRKK